MYYYFVCFSHIRCRLFCVNVEYSGIFEFTIKGVIKLVKMSKIILVASVCAMTLGGCATVDDMKLAQATADQALALAKEGKMAAEQAQGTADQGVAAAGRAQATADQASAAAKVADDKAESAGDLAAKTDKSFWQHHETHHRHRKPR